jgi:hypothetical protein
VTRVFELSESTPSPLAAVQVSNRLAPSHCLTSAGLPLSVTSLQVAYRFSGRCSRRCSRPSQLGSSIWRPNRLATGLPTATLPLTEFRPCMRIFRQSESSSNSLYIVQVSCPSSLLQRPLAGGTRFRHSLASTLPCSESQRTSSYERVLTLRVSSHKRPDQGCRGSLLPANHWQPWCVQWLPSCSRAANAQHLPR